MSEDQFKADPDSDVLIIDTKKEENRFSRFELIRGGIKSACKAPIYWLLVPERSAMKLSKTLP
jgi:hypothetical protein